MNKHAAILAADSAVTVTEWDGERMRTRYFKGANKIFQISNSAPVGVMIYGGSELQGNPWEIIIKDYRKTLSSKRFNYTKEYADDFFNYLKTHQAFFSEERRQELSILGINGAVGEIYTEAQKNYGEKVSIEQLEEFVENVFNTLDALPVAPCFSSIKTNEIEQKYLITTSNGIQELLKSHYVSDKLTEISIKLSKTAIKALLVNPTRYLNSTGIVFTGFGEKDYFPVLVEYKCFGFLFEEMLFEHEPDVPISIDNPAYVKPFAMNEMVNTFLNGVGEKLFGFIMNNIDLMLDYNANKVIEIIKSSSTSNIDLDIKNNSSINEHKKDSINQFRNIFFDNIRKEHRSPLMRVVGSLSISEMSELAETLIMLESLKERMTKDSESVGGAVDVAAINKNEGFVWIKRKHYFDPKLNVKYFQRNLFQAE